MIDRYSVDVKPPQPYRDDAGLWVKWADVAPYMDSLICALSFLVEVGLEPPEVLSPKHMRSYSKQSGLSGPFFPLQSGR